MLKNAQSLVMLAVLALSGVVGFSFGNWPVRESCQAAGYGAKVARHGSLPMLAESAAPSQTDNSTLPVTSGGAVEASFTVISRPRSDRVESATPSTVGDEGGPGSSPAATLAQEENGVASDQQERSDNSGTAVSVGAKSGGLTPGWALLVGAWAVGDVALGVFAFRYGRTGRRSLGLEERGDLFRQPPVCEPDDQAG